MSERDTDAFGITAGYHDVDGSWHPTSDASRGALRAAMGVDSTAELPPASPPVWFVRCGDADPLLGPCGLVLEDGTDLGALTQLPSDLPAGYHDLCPADEGPTTRLIASPGRCHLPPDLRSWAWAVQLYAARSSRSWGIGDLDDLARLVERASLDGAWGTIVNPLHAVSPTFPQQASPYYPSSRRWLNPLHLAIDVLPGADAPDIRVLAAKARALNDDRIIDRDAVWRAKSTALDVLYAQQRERGLQPDYSAWRDSQGADLLAYARFCALAEHHGTGWRTWPVEHQHPDSAGVARFAAAHADRVEHHAWVQWLLHEQLAGIWTRLITDLAVGVDPEGADAWLDQDVLALDAHVGAPPDDFAADGQDWGLPPFIPWKLRAARYEPFIAIIRSAMRTGGLRVDHVMGLFRLYWVLQDAHPSEGAYVRYPGRELLDIVCIESARARTLVVGEDLGTVEDEVRAALHDAAVLSYRLAWFEPGPLDHLPVQALSAVTTHDLPTIAGVWGGADATELEAIERADDADAVRGLRDRLVELAGSADLPVGDVSASVHAQLAAAPSALVAATLEDALGVVERPNVPGTTVERPNWSIALPVSADEVLDTPGARAIAAAFSQTRPARRDD